MGNTITSIKIKPGTVNDADAWSILRSQLWQNYDRKYHLKDLEQDLARSDRHSLLAWQGNELVGLLEMSLRCVAEGCVSSPVAYMEGWYVKTELRGTGVGTALIKAGEEWARNRGCTEIGSDAEIGNHLSQTVHKALGFEEVKRVVQLRKSLKED